MKASSVNLDTPNTQTAARHLERPLVNADVERAGAALLLERGD
jgi:hypothetical protein